MAATKTLAELRAMVRELADMESSAPTTAFVDTSELDNRINEALKQLYNLLIQARGQAYYHESIVIAGVLNQNLYPVPSNFMELMGITVSDGSSVRQVPTWEYGELAYLRQLQSRGTTSSVNSYRARLQGPNLVIYPAPISTSHVFTLDYVPSMPPLVDVGDSFDGVNGWEKWAAYTAACDTANKEENYELCAALTQQRAVIQAQIEALASQRDAARPARIIDTRGDGRDPAAPYLGWKEADWF